MVTREELTKECGRLAFAIGVLVMVGVFCNDIYKDPDDINAVGVTLFAYSLIIGFICLVWISFILVSLSNYCHPSTIHDYPERDDIESNL